MDELNRGGRASEDARRGRGDHYDDLADAVERGTLKRDRSREWRERKLAGKGEQPPEIEADRGGDGFDDLAEAVERGAVDGDNGLSMRCQYTVNIDTWERMRADLLRQLLADFGSIRRLARVVEVPRSTLSSWYRGIRERGFSET